MSVQDKIKNAKKSDWKFLTSIPKRKTKWWIFMGKLKARIYRKFKT